MVVHGESFEHLDLRHMNMSCFFNPRWSRHLASASPLQATFLRSLIGVAQQGACSGQPCLHLHDARHLASGPACYATSCIGKERKSDRASPQPYIHYQIKSRLVNGITRWAREHHSPRHPKGSFPRIDDMLSTNPPSLPKSVS
jgi:hypothetical protein